MSAKATATERLRERAAALAPVLGERAEATEQDGRVPAEHFDALSDAGILQMCAPTRFGGSEADFQTQCDVLALLAQGCASTSWVATIFSAMSWLAAVFPDEAQDEVFASGDLRMSGAFSPTGTSRRVDGGVRVTGRWPYNTGCHGADWTFLNTIVENDAGAGEPLSVIVRSSELTILDDWHASGMAGTGSNTVVAADIAVPAYRTIPLQDLIDARFPTRHNSDNPYFNHPVVPVLVVNAGGTPLGIARGALQAFMERLPGRQITYTDYTNQAEAPITHLQVGEAALKIDSAQAHVRLATEILDAAYEGPLPLPSRVRSRAHIGHSTGLAREAVDALFHSSGASAIQSHVPIQRYQRDMQALANHAIMHPATAIELYGRILCGLGPNTTLV